MAGGWRFTAALFGCKNSVQDPRGHGALSSSKGGSTTNKSKSRAKKKVVVFHENRNVVITYKRRKKMATTQEMLVEDDSWFTDMEILEMRQSAAVVTQRLVAADAAAAAAAQDVAAQQYPRVLWETFQSLVDGPELTEKERDKLRRVMMATHDPLDRMGIEQHLVPELALELETRRYHKVRAILALQQQQQQQHNNNDQTNADALADEIAATARQWSQPSQLLAAVLAHEYERLEPS